MSSEVQANLGTTCKGNGSFYVCNDKPSKFLGCCSVDACKTDDGICPDDDLEYTSYDRYSHNEILKQECQSDRPEVQWWTCGALDIPFMGCCSTNPCVEEDGCPRKNLFPAKLSSNEDDAAVFLQTSDEAGGGDDESSVDDDGVVTLSTGTIAGVSAGVGVVAILIIAAIIFLCLRRRNREKNQSDKSPTAQQLTPAYSLQAPGFHGQQYQDPRLSPRSPPDSSHTTTPTQRPRQDSVVPQGNEAAHGGQRFMWAAGGKAGPLHSPYANAQAVNLSPQELPGVPMVTTGYHCGSDTSGGTTAVDVPGQECEVLGDVGYGAHFVEVRKDGSTWL